MKLSACEDPHFKLWNYGAVLYGKI